VRDSEEGRQPSIRCVTNADSITTISKLKILNRMSPNIRHGILPTKQNSPGVRPNVLISHCGSSTSNLAPLLLFEIPPVKIHMKKIYYSRMTALNMTSVQAARKLFLNSSGFECD
jgi:hypothetical protein